MLDRISSEKVLRANEQLLRRCTSFEQALKVVPNLIVDPTGCVSLEDMSVPESTTKVFKLSNLPDDVFYLPGFVTSHETESLTEEILSEMIDSPPHSNSFGESNDGKLRFDEPRLNRLRWSCVGYHYNWGERSYSPELKSDFPQSFTDIYHNALSAINTARDNSRQLGPLVGKPESAIINFYHSKRISDRLGGHRDDVEVTDATPLVALSMGLAGVFLIESEAIVLRSGDIVVMASDARQSIHGVPCILSGKRKHKQLECDESSILEKTRISISIRQVY